MPAERVLPFVVAVLTVLPAAAAGAAEAPEVVDDAGDVRHSGVPIPSGAEWADLTAAWFQLADDDTLVLAIRLAGGDGPPPQGEVGVTFRVGDSYFIAGWTAFPPFYSGGFLSGADANGDVPADVDPAAADATWDGPLIEVRIPVAVVDPDRHGNLSAPTGWSESQASNGRSYRMDETATGQAYTWAAVGAASPPSPSATVASTPISLLGPFLALLLAFVGRTLPPRPKSE